MHKILIHNVNNILQVESYFTLVTIEIWYTFAFFISHFESTFTSTNIITVN